MSSTEAQSARGLTIGLFESVQQGAEAIDGLLEDGTVREDLGLLMTDRAAERAFGRPEVRDRAGANSTFSGDTRALAAELKPLTPLGTVGSGLVATGPLGALLLSAGVGSRGGFEHALQGLGLAGRANEVVRRVTNGAVLVSVSAHADEPPPHAFTGDSALFWRVPVTAALTRSSVVTRPLAPTPERGARYQPVIESHDELGR